MVKMSTIELLKDKHKDQTCYIIGSGTSINNLTKSYFKPDQPIITLNLVVKQIEKLEISNTIYSMQKDGEKYHLGNVFRPERSVLLVSEDESIDLYTDYKPRYIFDAQKLCNNEYGYKEFSANCALKIAQIFGCKKIILMGFDSYWGNINNIYGTENKVYIEQIERMKILIIHDNLDVEWIKEC
jgi:uncharacterized Rossmann fold enzyme